MNCFLRHLRDKEKKDRASEKQRVSEALLGLIKLNHMFSIK